MSLKTMYFLYGNGVGTSRLYCEGKDMAVGVECRSKKTGFLMRWNVKSGPDWGECQSKDPYVLTVICLGTHEPRS